MLNVSRQAISKWESNKAYPDIDNLMLLKNIFNVSLDDLVECGNVIKIEGREDIAEECELSTDKNVIEEVDEDEVGDNLMMGGLLIGTAIGFITENFIWGTVGCIIGMGIGYIAQDKMWNNKK